MTKAPHIRLRPLIVSEQWTLLEGYLEDRKTVLMTQLETCELEDLKNIQGSVQILNELLRLKVTLQAEGNS